MAGVGGSSSGGFPQYRVDRIDRIGLGQYRRIGMSRGGRFDMAAGREHIRNALLDEPIGDRPDQLALQIYVDDGNIEAALLDPLERVRQAIACPGHLVTERVEK